jgi:hypothetical protein
MIGKGWIDGWPTPITGPIILNVAIHQSKAKEMVKAEHELG